MIFGFIREHRFRGSLAQICGAFGVSRSGYYAWLKRGATSRNRCDSELLAEIRALHKQFQGRYGRPRITDELKARGFTCGANRVGRLMREAGLYGKPRKKRRGTTNSEHGGRICPNLLGRRFDVSAPNQSWVSDITYIPTDAGWLYLCVVLDLYSRKVVGWSTQNTLSGSIAIQALKMACDLRQPGKGLLFHSDRGIQYASAAFQAQLERMGFLQSMSRGGNCYDNAVAESFIGSLKTEEVNDATYGTRVEARNALFRYIEGFYNRIRRHSHNKGLSPQQFESTTFT